MPRQPRYELDAGMYHVTCRGNRLCDVFLDSIDRERFLSLLGDVVQRYRWRCFGYCLMTNHFHLVVETPEPNLGRGMHRLNGIYAQRFNQRWDYRGHLFQERFGSREILSEPHMAEVARYIVLNPVRAGVCGSAERWPWSSYCATMGTAPAEAFLAVDDLLAFFGRAPDEGRRAFEAFVRDGLEQRRR
jgi:REP element-mobilizing transposase RayT